VFPSIHATTSGEDSCVSYNYPPSLKVTEGIENLRQHVIPELDSSRFRYVVEVRDKSWFQDLAYNFFADNDMYMVWSQLAELRTPPVVTTDFLYL